MSDVAPCTSNRAPSVGVMTWRQNALFSHCDPWRTRLLVHRTLWSRVRFRAGGGREMKGMSRVPRAVKCSSSKVEWQIVSPTIPMPREARLSIVWKTKLIDEQTKICICCCKHLTVLNTIPTYYTIYNTRNTAQCDRLNKQINANKRIHKINISD